MSKRLGNGVDPFETIAKYGPDATRWYMITNSQPWDNLKFDSEGIGEVQRKFFGTLYNTYAFFALYANIDGFAYREKEIPVEQRPEIDRWIISELNTLIMQVDDCYADYEPTRAGRLIQDFVDEYLSNWYVRLCRRRFWKGDYSTDKISAYQTLYKCLNTTALLVSPIAPFFAEKLFLDLNNVTGKLQFPSVHLADFPVADNNLVDIDLEERMELAQKISSMVLSLRKKHNLRVRQPLAKIMLPITEPKTKVQVEAVKNLILSEVNVKEIEYIEGENNILVKKIKPDFKALGPKFGKQMKTLAAAISAMNQQQIIELEKNKTFGLNIDNAPVEISINDVEIITEDIPGWVVSVSDNITAALDTTLTPQLVEEGLAREFVNRIQTLRKELHFEVTDKIRVLVERQRNLVDAVENNNVYICSEILAVSIDFVDTIEGVKNQIELTDTTITFVSLSKA